MTALRQARLAAGLKMCDLSIVSGVDYARLSTFERGYGRPSRETAERLAAALRQPVATLFPNVQLRSRVEAGK